MLRRIRYCDFAESIVLEYRLQCTQRTSLTRWQLISDGLMYNNFFIQTEDTWVIKSSRCIRHSSINSERSTPFLYFVNLITLACDKTVSHHCWDEPELFIVELCRNEYVMYSDVKNSSVGLLKIHNAINVI